MRFRPATILAVLALFVAIGGTATAAGLINGSKIKQGTVTGKQIKNGTITKTKITTATIAALAGEQGTRGAQGEQGPKGPNGDPGAPGAPGTTTLVKTGTKTAQNPNLEVNQVVMSDLPGSRYIATAKVTALSQTAGSLVECRIEASPLGGSDEAAWTNPTNGNRGTLWMVLPTENAVNEVKVVCDAGNSSATLNTKLTLVPAL